MLLEFEDSLAIFIKQENGISPMKQYCLESIAANKSLLLISNLQEIGDTWATVIVKTYKACCLLSFWRMSTTAVQILHFGQGRLRLFSGRCMGQRPNPESQNMALIGTRQLCSSSPHGKIQNNTKNKLAAVGSRNQIWLNPSPNHSKPLYIITFCSLPMYQPHQPRHVILASHSSPKESRLTIVSWQLSRPNSFTSPSQAIWNTRNMGEIMKVFKRRGWLCASFISWMMYCLYLCITVTLSSLSAYDFHSTMHEFGLKSKVHGYTVQSPRMVCHFLDHLAFIPLEKGPPKISVKLQPRFHPLLHLVWRYCWRVGCMETDRNIQNPAFRMAWNQVAKNLPANDSVLGVVL